nr:glycosyltransferase family 25 protein [Acinetobacter ihumii]
MKKYLISIEQPESPRLTNFFAQSTFSRYQSEFIQCGVIGADLPTREYFKLAVAGRKKPLSPAELGCTLSHLEALKNFLSTDEKYACIFEDDAISLKDFDLNSLETEISQLNLKECFFFSLGGIQLKSNQRVRGTLLDQQINEKQILQLHPLYFGRFFYTYAYVVDRKMAELLLQYHQPPKGCDHWSQITNYDPNCNFYATFLFDHPELDQIATGQSYIEQERQSIGLEQSKNKSFFLRLKISILKKFYNIFLNQYKKIN